MRTRFPSLRCLRAPGGSYLRSGRECWDGQVSFQHPFSLSHAPLARGVQHHDVIASHLGRESLRARDARAGAAARARRHPGLGLSAVGMRDARALAGAGPVPSTLGARLPNPAPPYLELFTDLLASSVPRPRHGGPPRGACLGGTGCAASWPLTTATDANFPVGTKREQQVFGALHAHRPQRLARPVLPADI